MSLAIVYWSGTGNTEIMANLVADGVKAAGGEAQVLEMENMSVSDLDEVNVFALGCPAMGDEELEETIVEPFVSQLESKVAGKKIGLFGSYSWADGEWMKSWVERMEKAGAEILTGEGVTAYEEPDEEAKEKCLNLGKSMVKA